MSDSKSPLFFYRACRSLIPDPLHILQENLLPAAIVELSCSAVGVPRDSLSGFKGAVIFQ